MFLETVSASPTKALYSAESTMGDFFDMGTSAFDIPVMHGHVQRRIARVTLRRILFVAEHSFPWYDPKRPKRFMGLGPEALCVGDVIAVLLGGPVPYVLRPNSDGWSFRFIGETYVHGVMSGEALHHVREDVHAGGCMLPPTGVQRCFAPLEDFQLR
jgi:hypothetical protein